jgi:protein CpxP
MKKLLLMVALVFGMTSVFAQSPTATEKNKGKQGQQKGQKKGNGQAKKLTPEERAAKHTEKMKTELTLTDDQISKVKAITLTRAQKIDEVRAKYAAAKDKANFKTERKAAFQAWETDLKGILTPEQLSKYEAKKAEKKKKLEERRKNAEKKTKEVKTETEDSVEDLEDEVGE